MQLKQILVEERTTFGIGVEDLAARLGVPVAEIRALEAGNEAAESWGIVLAELAVALGVPISRLIAETGRAADYRSGNCGRVVRHWREERGLSLDQLADASRVSCETLRELESGSSAAEHWMPILLGIAREVDQPLFNFFYPYGVPLRELDACL